MARVNIFAVIVLYKLSFKNSISFKSLLTSREHISKRSMKLGIYLIDNTPGALRPDDLPDDIFYECSKGNIGLSAAYNLAMSIGESYGFDWLLTLDQDTNLPINFLSDIEKLISSLSHDESVAAIVPSIKGDGRNLSPHSWRFGGINMPVESGFIGIPKFEVSALNSASTLRIASLRDIGGYNLEFWLDCSDVYIFRQLYLHRKKVFIAGNIIVDHELSILDMKHRMSIDRYYNILAAGSAFRDLHMGIVSGWEFTVRLLARLVYKHPKNRDPAAIRMITKNMLYARLFMQKKKRIKKWRYELEMHRRQKTQ